MGGTSQAKRSGKSMDFAGRTALVTGAASGIGRAIAVVLAERGAHLALADIDTAGLEETKRMLRPGPSVSIHTLDMADADAIAAMPEAVLREHGHVDLLFNIAGVALGGRFEQTSETDFDWLMEVNFFGTVRMVRAMLPVLRQAPEAWIVNISSIFGIISPPGQAAYSASKFAVRGFSNALRHELRNTRIGVSVVHPGGVATAIANRARQPADVGEEEAERELKRMNRMLKMPADAAGKIIVDAVARRKARIMVGSDAKIAALMERLMPVSHLTALKWLTGRSL